MLGYELLTEMEMEASYQSAKANLEKHLGFHDEINGPYKNPIINDDAINSLIRYVMLNDLQATALIKELQEPILELTDTLEKRLSQIKNIVFKAELDL